MSMSSRFALSLALLLSLFALTVNSPAHAETLWWWVVMHNNESRPLLESQAAAFEAANPGVEVDISFVTWKDMEEKLTTVLASGAGPDIVPLGGIWMAEYAAAGMLLPLDTYVRDWDALDEFHPVVVEDGRYQGQLYALPYMVNPKTLTLSRTVFEEAGLNPDDPPETWEDLERAAQRVRRTDAEGRTLVAGLTHPGPGNPVSHWQNITTLIAQAGGSIVTPDGSQATLDTPEVVRAIEFYAKLIRDGLSTQGAGWRDGKLAMDFNAPSTRMLNFKATQPEVYNDLKVALPTRDVVRAGNFTIDKYAISSTSKNPDLAWKFLSYVLSPEQLQAYNLVSGGIGPQPSLVQRPELMSDPVYIGFVQAIDYGFGFPIIPSIRRVQEVVSGPVAAAAFGEIPSEYAAGEAQRLVSEVLE